MMTLADVVDAVIGGDTHRDTHALEMVAPSGATMAVLSIANDEDGFAEAIAWIAEHAPGPRIVVGLEGTRSYGIGLARAAVAAGLVVTEVQAPRRPDRRGRGKTARSTRTWPRSSCWPCPPASCPRRARTATGRPCGSCSVPAAN